MRKRLNYANVTATLALFFAMSGGALAAKHYLISSTKQINPKVLKQLRGKNGTNGASGPKGESGSKGESGPQGVPGLTGPRGPSNGRATSTTGNVEVGSSEGSALVVNSLTLAPGKWMLTGETGITNISGASRSAWCTLNNGATVLGTTRALDETTQRSGHATVLGAVELPSGGTIQFKCWASSTFVFIPAVSNPAMQAIQVETLGVS